MNILKLKVALILQITMGHMYQIFIHCFTKAVYHIQEADDVATPHPVDTCPESQTFLVEHPRDCSRIFVLVEAECRAPNSVFKMVTHIHFAGC